MSTIFFIKIYRNFFREYNIDCAFETNMSEKVEKINPESELSSIPINLTPDGKLSKVIIKEGVGEPPRRGQEVFGNIYIFNAVVQSSKSN